MKEYRVLYQDITTIVSRDLPKATAALESQVNELVSQGWTVQGGISSVQAGASIYLIQAMVR